MHSRREPALETALVGIDLSDEDRTWLLDNHRTALWVPEISSEDQCDRYSRLHHKLYDKLTAGLPSRDDNSVEWTELFAAQLETPLGMLTTAIKDRLRQWEETRDDDDDDE
ncbi:MAG TPA: hypothetical protein VN620_03915 [Candidatus Methylomirabilis sp.]|nr:hypothetical protein [Candidatus Methylomirabilis sp.]